MILTAIAQQHIADLWDWVRHGLLEIKRRATPESCPWLPEDVYHALRNNAAVLYVIGAEDGFIVAQRLESTYERVMFVWAMWAPPGTLVRHRDEIMAAIDDLARSAGLNRIRMHSTREGGWTASKLFVPVSTIFEREVTL